MPLQDIHLRPVRVHAIQRIRARINERTEPPLAFAQFPLRQHLASRLRASAEHSRDLAALVAYWRVGEREPGLLVVTLTIHQQRQVFAPRRLACHGGIDQGTDVRPDLEPDVVEAPAHRARMFRPENLGIRIVVKKPELRTPCNEHWKTRLQQQPYDASERLRPRGRETERRVIPVEPPHQGASAAATLEKLELQIKLTRGQDKHPSIVHVMSA